MLTTGLTGNYGEKKSRFVGNKESPLKIIGPGL